MTCKHCVGADHIFDRKNAEKQLKRYRRKGPRKTSRLLIEGIIQFQHGCKDVLDIGGGIGSVHLEFLNSGIEFVTSVDASFSYLELAKKEAIKQNKAERIQYKQGNFLDIAPTLTPHSIVVLDKVICCYPYMEELLKTTMSKTTVLLALVYPKNNLLGKVIITIGNIMLFLKRNDFRVFLHPNRYIKDLIRQEGFELRYSRISYPWNIEVYQRK